MCKNMRKQTAPGGECDVCGRENRPAGGTDRQRTNARRPSTGTPFAGEPPPRASVCGMPKSSDGCCLVVFVAEATLGVVLSDNVYR